jgi:hypothetical protein
VTPKAPATEAGPPQIEGRKRPTDAVIKASIQQHGNVYSKVVAQLRGDGYPLSHWFRGEYDRVLAGMGDAVPVKKGAKRASTPTMANPTGKGPSRVDLMKRAADKLRAAGRYTGEHKITITEENYATIAGAAISEIMGMPEEQPQVQPIPKKGSARKAS